MIQQRNSIMRGARGMLGRELVFRQRAGKTVISLAPVFRSRQPSVAQLARRDRFRRAVRYAKMVLADPVLKAEYEARLTPGSTVYNTVIKEYMSTLPVSGAAALQDWPADCWEKAGINACFMKLSDALVKKLSEPQPPSTIVDMTFKGNDLSFKTDEHGNAILLFIGKRNANGNIKGERYARTLKYDREGHVIKDHWELKGPAS